MLCFTLGLTYSLLYSFFRQKNNNNLLNMLLVAIKLQSLQPINSTNNSIHQKSSPQNMDGSFFGLLKKRFGKNLRKNQDLCSKKLTLRTVVRK